MRVDAAAAVAAGMLAVLQVALFTGAVAALWGTDAEFYAMTLGEAFLGALTAALAGTALVLASRGDGASSRRWPANARLAIFIVGLTVSCVAVGFTAMGTLEAQLY